MHVAENAAPKQEEDIFQMWKAKLKKHEENQAMMINNEYRSEKRMMKLQKEKAS